MLENISEITTEVFSNPLLAGSLIALSVVTFIGSLLLLPWLILRLPENYFVDPKRHISRLHQTHPLVYLLLRLGKNLLGVLLLTAGIAMLVLPGQGLLTILIGISLLDFPGKFRLERSLVRRPGISKVINWIRRKGNKSDLMIP